jgi:methylenetetrahydrofolate reductase (NADPH)
MRIRDLLARDKKTFSFEFFPPKTPSGETSLFRTIEELKSLSPSFVSVTYGALGSTREKTFEIVAQIKKDYGIEAMAHLTCVASSRDQIRGILHELKSKGIENTLALRGDPPEGTADFARPENGFAYANELVEEIRGFEYFSIGVAGFPEMHPRSANWENDIRYLKTKVDAGADFVITQLFFDNGLYFDYVKRARMAGIGVPIIPGIMPITDYKQLEKFTTMCGASIPERIRRDLYPLQEDLDAVYQYGVNYARKQCQELLDGGSPGLHFYTLNKSRATRDIFAKLRK